MKIIPCWHQCSVILGVWANFCLCQDGLDLINCRSQVSKCKWLLNFQKCILAIFWSSISGFYPSPHDVKKSLFWRHPWCLISQGLTLTTGGLVRYRVFKIKGISGWRHPHFWWITLYLHFSKLCNKNYEFLQNLKGRYFCTVWGPEWGGNLDTDGAQCSVRGCGHNRKLLFRACLCCVRPH